VELIDIAERVNPERGWCGKEHGKRRCGRLVESEYFPILVLHASAGGQSIPFPIPRMLVPAGFSGPIISLQSDTRLRWLLFDFGRRRAALTLPQSKLLAANLGSITNISRLCSPCRRASTR